MSNLKQISIDQRESLPKNGSVETRLSNIEELEQQHQKTHCEDNSSEGVLKKPSFFKGDRSFKDKKSYLRSVHVCSLKNKNKENYLKHLPAGKSLIWIKLILVSPINPLTKFYFRSTHSIDMERKRHILTNNLHVIHPFSIFTVIWSHWMLFVFSISLIAIPLDIVWFICYQETKLSALTMISILIDLLCLTDIGITFFTGIGIEDTKEVVLEQKLIARKYILSIYFPLDVISSFPLDLIQIIIKMENFNELRLLKLFSLVKIVRARTVFQRLNHVGEMIHLNSFLIKAISYIFSTFLIIHWFGCLAFIIPAYALFLTENILFEDMLLDDGWTIYLNHIFETMGLMLCTHEFNPVFYEVVDSAMAIIYGIIGKVYIGIMLVLIFQMIMSSLSSRVKYNEIMDQLQNYMKHKKLPIHLQKKMVMYYKYRFQKTYFRESGVKNTLPTIIMNQINLFTFRKLLESVVILRMLSPEEMNIIITKLVGELFLPNDVIIKAGSLADCIYFLLTGTCSVLTPSGREVCHLESGSYFGELALLSKDNKRTADVIAIEICQVFRLDAVSFKKYLIKNKYINSKIKEIAVTRKQQSKLIEEMHQKFIMTKLTQPKVP